MKAKLKKQSDGDYILILNNPKECLHSLPLLSKQNCDEIFGVVDVEKLAYEHRRVYQDSFEGMDECKMKDAILHLMNNTPRVPIVGEAVEIVRKETEIIEFIIAVILVSRQLKEIEVKIEMERVVDETKVIGAVKGVKGSGHKTTTYKSVPKLDADGCLILKTI